MTKIEENKINKSPTYPTLIGGGGNGSVFRFTKETVGKFFKENLRYNWSNEKTLTYLTREFLVQDFLYRSGLSVPKPYGVEERRLCVRKINDNFPSLIMEYFPGKIADIYKNYSEIYSLAKKEKEKARDMGFVESADWSMNILYSSRLKKVCLIDFGSWSPVEFEKRDWQNLNLNELYSWRKGRK